MEVIENGYDFKVHVPLYAEYALKLSHDNLVGVCRGRLVKRKAVVSAENKVLKELFEKAYAESVELNLKGETRVFFINDRMNESYRQSFSENLITMSEEKYNFVDYIRERLKAKGFACFMRLKRFRDKASLHLWNYFVTQTYDSSKFKTEEEFKTAYLTCLSHLATDYGWRYMGVFERGDRTGRLHFHGIFYIPTGSMKGYMKNSRYFSPYEHRMKNSVINSFFAVRFGRCDFENISKDNAVTAVSNYILKYVTKSENKVVYSRGIQDSVEVELSSEDIIFGYKRPYAVKYVVFSDILRGTIIDNARQLVTGS